MKILIFVLFLLGSYTITYSQDPLTYTTPHNNSENFDQNNMLIRYWYYRWRLQNDFLIIGDKPGYSIPAEDREGVDSRALRWGDGTIWLGNYICMLGLENALIRYSDRYYDLLKNERELYYAMQAFNRLDEQGDTYYDADNGNGGNNTNSIPACKNGFFIRDDVPVRFFTTNYMDASFSINDPNTWTTTIEYNHFTEGKSGINYYYHPFYALSSGALAPKDSLPSYHPETVPDYTQSYIPISHDDKNAMGPASGLTFAMSQDQVYRLLLGFATVIRTLPDEMRSIDTDDDGYGDTPFNFVEEAKIHCTNMIARLNGVSSNINHIEQNNNDIPCNESVSPTFFTRWFCKDPLFEKPGIGNNSWVYSPEVTKIWEMYYTPNHTIPNLTHNYVDYQSSIASGSSSVANTFNFFSQIFTSTEQSNSKLILYTSLVSGYIPYLVLHDATFNELFNVSRGNINHQFRYFGWHTYIMPLYCYLHDFHPQHNTAQTNWLQTRLDMATQVLDAPCWGPYNFVDVNSSTKQAIQTFTDNYGGGNWIDPLGSNGWNTSFRFDQRAYKTIHGFQDGWADNGFFNGIDYMSEVNLFYIASNTYTSQPTILPFYQNLIDRYVDYTVSSDNTPMLGAFNSMIITKPITGSGSLDIQAGSFVDLQDGTHITASQSSKHVFIKTFSCNNIETGNYKSPLVNDSLQEAQPQRWLANNDYGFNEVFTQKKYDVHPNMSNAPTAQEILNRNTGIPMEESDSIVIYPNPARSEFSIKNIQTQKVVNSNVYLQEMDGKIVPVEQTRGEYNISNLSPGTYIVHLLFPSGAVSDKKLIVLP